MDAEVEDTKNNTTEESFLSELKSQFEKLIDLRKTLDGKANTMITIDRLDITQIYCQKIWSEIKFEKTVQAHKPKSV